MRIAICDDQIDYLLFVKRLIKSICQKHRLPVSVKTFDRPIDLINSFKKEEFDIVFLDIEMPAMSGKECARKLRAYNKYFKLVFITSHKDEVYTSFEYDICSFIPKHMVHDHLETELIRIYDYVKTEKEKWLSFKIVTEYNEKAEVKFPVSDIMYFESINRKVYLHTLKNTYLLRGDAIEKLKIKMREYNFIEIHRLTIVNLSAVYAIENDEIILDNGVRLIISRKNIKQIVNCFKDYLKKELIK